MTELLTEARAEVRGRELSQVRGWQIITAWADQNVIETTEGAATLMEGVIDTGVPIAGDGAPLVSEFNLMELIATLGRTPDGGRAYVGKVIECAWRLHGVYAAVLAGRIPTYKAQRIAELTRSMNAEAAGFVDAHLAAVRDPGWAQIERLIREAVIRFDPERAEEDRQKAADQRHFDVHNVDGNGLVQVDGLLDAADGHDLDEAVARRAALRGRLGDDSPLDVRRSIAAGELARQDLALDLLIADEDTGEILAQSPGRKVELSVHITDTALAEATSEVNPVGRWEEGDCPISTTPGSSDASGCVTTPAATPAAPPRPPAATSTTQHRTLRAGRPAPAISCRPLCRRHHRAKTFSDWRYVILEPGRYLWTSPHGRQFLVGPGGTRALDPPRTTDPHDH